MNVKNWLKEHEVPKWFIIFILIYTVLIIIIAIVVPFEILLLIAGIIFVIGIIALIITAYQVHKYTKELDKLKEREE